MFVGTTGVAAHRGADRRADEASTAPTTSAPHGGIPLSVIQKYLNFQFSVSHGPVRLGAVHQRRQLLLLRAQGPLAGDPAQGRPRAARRRPARCTYVEDGEIVQKTVPMLQRAQPRPARRVRRRLRQRRAPLEPGAGGRGARAAAARCRTRGSTAGSAPTPTTTSARRARCSTTRPGRRRVDRLAAARPRTARAVAALMVPEYEPGKFAGWITAAADRHQRPAGRVRLRAPAGGAPGLRWDVRAVGRGGATGRPLLPGDTCADRVRVTSLPPGGGPRWHRGRVRGQ